MAIGSIGSYLSPTRGYFSTDGTLLKYMTSLAEQKKALTKDSFKASDLTTNTPSYNESLFKDLGDISNLSGDLRSGVSSMASLSRYSSGISKEAAYTDESILSANVSNGAAVSSYTKTDVNVSQLASAQQNMSSVLNANENTFGSNFSIGITDSAGKTSTFDVALAETATNSSALKAMADKINAAGAGFKAEFAQDAANGTVSLKISGSKTGAEDGKFTIADGSAANLGNVLTASQNAQYSVNGLDFSSQSNSDVKLRDGVTATLNKTGATQLTYKQDMSAAVDKVQDFLDTFNDMRKAASGSSTLTNQLSELSANSRRALGFAGIGINTDGQLSITDESKLSSSIEDGSFARNFQGVSSFGNRLTNVAGNAYKTAYNSAVQQNFKEIMDNFMNQNEDNNNNNWLYNLATSSGLLFNMRA